MVGGPDCCGGQAKTKSGRETDAWVAAPVAVPIVVAAITVARRTEATAISTEVPMMPDADSPVAMSPPETMSSPEAVVASVVSVETVPPTEGTGFARRREQNEGRDRRKGDC